MGAGAGSSDAAAGAFSPNADDSASRMSTFEGVLVAGAAGGGALAWLRAAAGSFRPFPSARGFHSSSAAGRSSQSLTSWYADPQASEQNETPWTSTMHIRQTGFSHALHVPTDGDSG